MSEKQLSNEEKAKMSKVLAQKGSSLAGIGMGVAQALQTLEEQKQNGQLSNEDVEVYNQIMSNEGVKKFLEKTSEKNDVSQIKENDTLDIRMADGSVTATVSQRKDIQS